MRTKKSRDRDAEFKKKIAQEQLILDVTESVFEQLEIQSKSKADLAEAMGRSKAYVTQLLNGSRNMTLRTLSDVAFALDVEPRFEIGFRDQLCQEPHWHTLVEPNLKIRHKVHCHAFVSDERSLSGEWIDACVEDRAA